MREFKGELVKDENVYYLNVAIDGEIVKDISEYVSYRTLKKELKDKYNLILPSVKEFDFKKFGRKQYANIEYAIN